MGLCADVGANIYLNLEPSIVIIHLVKLRDA
jgi:hypothetical protein